MDHYKGPKRKRINFGEDKIGGGVRDGRKDTKTSPDAPSPEVIPESVSYLVTTTGDPGRESNPERSGTNIQRDQGLLGKGPPKTTQSGPCRRSNSGVTHSNSLPIPLSV